MKSGANLSVIKDYNQGLVLQLIRVEDGISRVEIAQRTGLTAQTVTNIVNRLLEQDLVLEAGKQNSTLGKPRVRVRMNSLGGYAIGARIGRAELAVVVVNLDGKVIAQTTRLTEQGAPPARILDLITADIAALIDQSGVDSSRIFGIGVAAPGPLSHETGVVLNPPQFPGWEEVPVRQMLEERTRIPVIVDYSAKAAATWERWAGAARHSENFAFIYVSTGVGAGLFLDGDLRRGLTGGAGALGHVGIDPAGPICPCGGRGCLELYCSVPAIIGRARRELRNHGPFSRDLAFKDIETLAENGNRAAGQLFKDAAHVLGYGIKSLVNVTDIDLIVLGGRMFTVVGPIFVETIQRMLDDQSFGHRQQRIRVLLSSAPGDTVAVGAATLVLHARLTPKLVGLPIR